MSERWRRVDLSDEGPPLSRDAQDVLRALSWLDHPANWVDPDPGAFASSISELPIRRLAREARLPDDRTRAAVEELIARGTEGLGLEGDQVVLRG